MGHKVPTTLSSDGLPPVRGTCTDDDNNDDDDDVDTWGSAIPDSERPRMYSGSKDTGKTSIDLRSDTVTRPSAAMREAMAAAVVGDDVWGDDPTVVELESMASDVLGKEAALYFPSGTMANQIATFFKTQPGEDQLDRFAAHINDFWEPRMRTQLQDYIRAGGAGLDPSVEAAARLLRD